MAVIDAFPFFNENELLRARMLLLRDAVTMHVAVEGNRTHQGFTRGSALTTLSTSKGRLVSRVAQLSEGDGDGANWRREREQRDFLREMFDDLELDPEDLVLLTDADEIPDPAVIPRVLEVTEGGPVILGMRMIYYGCWENPVGWWHAKACRVRDLPESLTDLRLRFDLHPVVDAGWHLSYLGNEGRLRRKVTAFAHAENSEFDAWERIRTGGRMGLGPNGEQLVPFDPEELPEVLRAAVSAAS